MPKLAQQAEFDALVDLISTYPMGITVDALIQLDGIALQGRSLQRRLAMLVDERRLIRLGASRSTRYIALDQGHSSRFASFEVAQNPARYSLTQSKAGEEIRACVTKPRMQRKPVGYQIEFLEQYYPNQTFYLPQDLLDQLQQIGRSPAEQTPAGTFARDILNRLLTDLSWASSKLEGNTYSQLDTERLIEFGQAAEGKDTSETQMILNHKIAIEYLVRDPELACLRPETVIALHSFLSDGLMKDPLACGRIRKCQVGIGGSVYRPLGFPQQLEELFGIVIRMAAEIHNPFEQAFFLMVHIPYLQPFQDVNKRVSRLAANIPFIRHNLCPLSFIDVTQQDYVDAMLGVYELNRIELLRDVFVSAYERSCQQYLAVTRDLVPPDVFRMRYRRELSTVIAGLIHDDQAAAENTIRGRTPSTVAMPDIDHFVSLVLTEFKSIHPGNAIRFGVSPLEFSAWQARHQ
ncbi:Fic family protein [Oxalobacteraceae bacterium GrIS 2.11]